MRRFATTRRGRWLVSQCLVLILFIGCSSSLDNRPGPGGQTSALGPRQSKLRLPTQDIASKYEAAKASPKSFEPVFDYARTVALFCLASLLDTTCASCQGGLPRYRPRSELDTSYWPMVDDVIPMLDPFLEDRKLDAGQMDQLVSVRGRLLWLAGRSAEEESLINNYADGHPTAVSVVKRRLELLREADDPEQSESQCSLSRASMRSAPEAARLELLTSCVALHPKNDEARSDLLDYATYLPKLSPDEDALYRTYLERTCVEKVGDEESRCAEACACADKDSRKAPTTKCKRACRGCRNETAQAMRVCKRLGEVTRAPEHRARHRRKRAARR